MPHTSPPESPHTRHGRSVAGALDALRRTRRLRAGPPPQVAIPRLYAETLTARAHDDALWTHYLDLLPALRIELLWGDDPAARLLYHSPLDAARLPRLSGALRALDALTGGRAAERLGRAGTLAAFYEDTCFGAWLPPLYGYPADVAAYAAEVAAGADLHAVIDDRLAAPILHECCHFGRERHGLPVMFDECVSGYLGVSLLRGTAYPEPGRDHALYSAPWFSQIGQALERVIGRERLVAAHQGTASWASVAPPGLMAAARDLEARRQAAEPGPNLLPGFTRPDDWIAAIYEAAAGRSGPMPTLATGPVEDPDRAIVRDALSAMCLEPRREGLCFRVRQAAPPGPVRIDAARGWVSGPARPLDQAPPRYPLSPAVAARLVGLGHAALEVDLRPEGIEGAAAVLTDGPGVGRGPGFRIARASGER